MSKIYLFILPFLILLLYGGCSSSNQEANTCYLPTSSNPCFDSNVDGSTSTVIDQTVEEVISDQENMEGFQMSLAIAIIEEELAFTFIGTDPGCPYEQSELVIKTANDWNRFRNSCFFSSFDLPVINFQNNIVFVSTQQFAGYGTSIKAVLELNDRLVVIIEDKISAIPTPAPAFPISIVSVPRADLPVNFIRVKKDAGPISPDCLDPSSDPNILENNAECPTDALVQMCNNFICSDSGLIFHPILCEASSCFDFSCALGELDNTLEFIGTGDFNIETVVGNQITGMVTIDFFGGGMGDFEYSCSPLVN